MVKDLCFEIIKKCPNNCLFCSSESSIEATTIIPFDIFKQTIDYFMKKGGVEEISLSGGEPFLHPDLLKMVEYCKKNNITTVIYTSGIIKRHYLSNSVKNKLNDSELKIINQIESNPYDSINREILRKLKELGLDKIIFDFQSSNVDGYNYLMGTKNQYSNLLNSLLYAHFEGLETEINFIPLRSNYDEFDDILELAELGNVSRINVLKFVSQGRGRTNSDKIMLSVDELREFKKYVEGIKSSKVKIRMGIPMMDNDYHLCNAGYDKFDIRYDGVILPCPSFKDIDLQILKDNGVQVHNIYEDLEELDVVECYRKKPLCKTISARPKNQKV